MRPRPSALTVDRVVTLVLALALLTLGAWFLAWYADLLPSGLIHPDEVTLAGRDDLLSREWWPWALGGAGVLAVLLALWWLLGHTGRDRVDTLTLTGVDTGDRGRLEVDAQVFAVAAGEIVASRAPDIRSGTGRLLRERGRLVLDLHVVAEPHVDLRRLRTTLLATVNEASDSLGRRDWLVRCHVDVARRAARQSRVS